MHSMNFLNSGYRSMSKLFGRTFSRLKNQSLEVHLHDYHKFSGNFYQHLHMQSCSVKYGASKVHCNNRITEVLIIQADFQRRPLLASSWSKQNFLLALPPQLFMSMRGKSWENYTNRQKYLKPVLTLHASTPLKALDIFLSILFFIPYSFHQPKPY